MTISKKQAVAFCKWFNANKDTPPTPYTKAMASSPTTYNDIHNMVTSMCAYYTLNVDRCGQAYYEHCWYPMFNGWVKKLHEETR